MMIQRKNRSHSTKTWARLGMASVCALTLACGEIDAPDSGETSMSGAMEAAEPGQPRATGWDAQRVLQRTGAYHPVGEYYDEAGDYYLECRTGADLPPLLVTPETNIGEWMTACTTTISTYSISQAQIDECRRHAFNFAFLQGRDGDGTPIINPKAGGPTISQFFYQGRLYSACSTGEIDAISHPPQSSSNYDHWLNNDYANWEAACLGGTVGGGPSLVNSFDGAHSLFVENVTGTGSGNPICSGLTAADIEMRYNWGTMTCSTTGRTISSPRSEGEFQNFSDECTEQQGQLEFQHFQVGEEVDDDVIYYCSSNGMTSLHSRGAGTFELLANFCQRQGGVILRHIFGDGGLPDVQSPQEFICTTTGESLSYSSTVLEYRTFQFDCAQDSGHVISTVTATVAGVDLVSPIGRDGRDDHDLDDIIVKAEIVGGYDRSGNSIWICMPKGNLTLPRGANIWEYREFASKCRDQGGWVHRIPLVVESISSDTSAD